MTVSSVLFPEESLSIQRAGRGRRGKGQDLGAGRLQRRGDLDLPASQHLVPDDRFAADVGRRVEHLALETRRKVLLGHPVVLERMRIHVAFTVAEAFLVTAGVPKVIGCFPLPLLGLQQGQGVEESHG